jgi:hypothetical protein
VILYETISGRSSTSIKSDTLIMVTIGGYSTISLSSTNSVEVVTIALQTVNRSQVADCARIGFRADAIFEARIGARAG